MVIVALHSLHLQEKTVVLNYNHHKEWVAATAIRQRRPDVARVKGLLAVQARRHVEFAICKTCDG